MQNIKTGCCSINLQMWTRSNIGNVVRLKYKVTLWMQVFFFFVSTMNNVHRLPVQYSKAALKLVPSHGTCPQRLLIFGLQAN